mgnify:FL=1
MNIISIVLLLMLPVCALVASFARSNFHTVIIFMVFGIIMSIIWLLLAAPDLAITEAAIGVGADSILFFLSLKKLDEFKKKGDAHEQVQTLGKG